MMRPIVAEILNLNPSTADLQSAMRYKKKMLGICTQQGCNKIPKTGASMCEYHSAKNVEYTARYKRIPSIRIKL